MPTHKKTCLTFEQQLNLLKSRGLGVTNNRKAINHLSRIGYYRLGAYWHPFQKIKPISNVNPNFLANELEDRFISSAKFQDVVNLYVFDKRLRLLMLDALERIEIALRVDISYLIGSKDPMGHTNPQLLHGNFVKKNRSPDK